MVHDKPSVAIIMIWFIGKFAEPQIVMILFSFWQRQIPAIEIDKQLKKWIVLKFIFQNISGWWEEV